MDLTPIKADVEAIHYAKTPEELAALPDTAWAAVAVGLLREIVAQRDTLTAQLAAAEAERAALRGILQGIADLRLLDQTAAALAAKALAEWPTTPAPSGEQA
jgi:hypothetical protein